MADVEDDDDLTVHMQKAGFPDPQQAAKAPDDEGRLRWTQIANGFRTMVGVPPKSKP